MSLKIVEGSKYPLLQENPFKLNEVGGYLNPFEYIKGDDVIGTIYANNIANVEFYQLVVLKDASGKELAKYLKNEDICESRNPVQLLGFVEDALRYFDDRDHFPLEVRVRHLYEISDAYQDLRCVQMPYSNESVPCLLNVLEVSLIKEGLMTKLYSKISVDYKVSLEEERAKNLRKRVDSFIVNPASRNEHLMNHYPSCRSLSAQSMEEYLTNPPQSKKVMEAKELILDLWSVVYLSELRKCISTVTDRIIRGGWSKVGVPHVCVLLGRDNPDLGKILEPSVRLLAGLGHDI